MNASLRKHSFAIAATAALAAAFTANAATLPASVEAKIAFWLKGDANLVTNASGQVIAWCDARETAVADESSYSARVTAGSWTYPRAIVYVDQDPSNGDMSSDNPLVGEAVATFGGKPTVDFGEYHDNKWLLLVDAAGARKRVFGSGYAGYIGFDGTAGFVVGDVDDPDCPSFSTYYSGQNGVIHYHKGSGGNGDDVIFGTTARGHRGETRVNGRVVDPTKTKHVRNGWEIFLQNGPNISGNPQHVSTLFNACNFKAGCMEGLSSDPTSRQGGGKVAEIMLFSSMLTQDEAAAVEAYLRQRWQGGSGSAEDVVALAAADALAADASSGPLFVGDVAGTGAIEKTGSGTLVIDRNGRLAAGPLALREGKVETFGKRSHHAPLVAIGGKRVSAGGSSLAIYDDSGNPDRFTIVESQARRIPLAGAEAGVAKVAVSTARLLLQPPALPEAAIAAVESPEFMAQGNLIRNGSFEQDTITGSGGNWQGNATGWTIGRIGGSSGSIGVEKWGSSTWANNNTANTGAQSANPNPDTSFPDGTQCAFIQVPNSQTNSLSQSVTVTATGLYRLSAWIRCRQRNYSDSSVVSWFMVDGTPVVSRRTGYKVTTGNAFSVTNKTPFNFQKLSVEIPLSATSHTIAIAASNPYGAGSTDRALCIDDVRLEPVAEGEFVPLRDPGFDTMANQPPVSSGTGIYRGGTTFDVSYWTIQNGGYTRYPSSWFWNAAYADTGEDQALYFGHTANRVSSASQSVSFPKAGRVRVSFRYANRSKNLSSGVARDSGQTLTASLGGTEFFSAVVTDEAYTTACAECDVSAGDATLAFATDKNSTILDDIRIEYVEDSPRIVSDTAFADNSASWTYSGAWAESDPYGLRELVFTNNASATLTFTAPSNGTYLLTFQTRGRPLSETGTDGVYHSYANYSHNLDVRLDGGFLANNYGEAATRHPVEMRLPYLTAGSHTLRFSGSCDASVRETAQSRISEVTVTSLATGTMADWSEMEFDLSNGAKIEADLGGTVKVKKLRVDGTSQIGEFTSANSAFVVGAGTIEVSPVAFVMTVR